MLKAGNKIKIIKIKKDIYGWYDDGVYEDEVYEIIDVGTNWFMFGDYILCYLKNDEDFEYEIVEG